MARRDWRRDVEEMIDNGQLRVKEQPRRRPAPASSPAPIPPAPKPAAPPLELSVAEQQRRQAIIDAQAADFADPKPKAGSAAAGIRARGSMKLPGEMNQTEASYAEILENLKRAGEIKDYRFEEMTLKTGVRAWYRPDFYVVRPDDSVYLVDVKAFRDDKKTGEMVRIINEDSEQKIKTCLLRHPYLILLAFGRVVPKKNGGGHEFREEWACGIGPCEP